MAVHTIRAPGIVLKKGTIIGPDEIAALGIAGIGEVVVARMEDTDIGEDVAAAEVASAVAGDHVRVERAFTGRSNLYAEAPGVLVVDEAAITALNRIDESITLATLQANKPVVPGEMIATVKIIPFAVPAASRDAAIAAAQTAAPLLRVAPYRVRKVGVISTLLPGLAPKVIEKTLHVTAERLAPADAHIVAEKRVPHEERALRTAIDEVIAKGAELVLIFGASAIADRRDVIPSAIEAAGGEIEYFGMPVDPGNLLLIGSHGDLPILGAPGCARSPKENGFDWVLSRLLAKLPVSRRDISGMGVGGLLMEIVTRPQPRADDTVATGKKAAIVLAAGRSSRMLGPNKLLAEINGVPLVRRTVEAALQSEVSDVVVVTGHMQKEVKAALKGLKVTFAHNPDFADGLSTSLRTGIAALPADADATVICLADMPQIDGALIDKLFDAFNPAVGALIVVPTVDGRRGNPVVWARRFFGELGALQGDVGARHLIGTYADVVAEVPMDGDAVFEDVDTPDAFNIAKARLERA
nr:molybdopterin-binding/glycosyltransferase family 2 protein [Variibacter gotjawalensis]